jgi:hypothetical protein
MPRPCRRAITTYASWTAGRQLCPGFPTRSTTGAESASRHLLVAGGAAAVSPRREPGVRGEGSQWGGSRRSSRRRSPKERLGDPGFLGQTKGLSPGKPSGSTTSSARDSQRVGSRLETVGGAPGLGRHAHGGGFDDRPGPPSPPSSWGYGNVWCRCGSWCRTRLRLPKFSELEAQLLHAASFMEPRYGDLDAAIQADALLLLTRSHCDMGPV